MAWRAGGLLELRSGSGRLLLQVVRRTPGAAQSGPQPLRRLRAGAGKLRHAGVRPEGGRAGSATGGSRAARTAARPRSAPAPPPTRARPRPVLARAAPAQAADPRRRTEAARDVPRWGTKR